MQQRLERLIGFLDRLFGGLACAALLAIVAVVSLQIVARYALPQAPAWTEELSRYLFAYAIVFAGGSVIARRRHVRLELFHHRLSRRTAAGFAFVCHLAIAAFAGYLLPYAWDYAMVGRRQTSPTLGLRMSWIFASAWVFFVLVCLFSVLAALKEWFVFRSDGKS